MLWAAEQAKREFQEKREVFCTDFSMTVHLRTLPGPLYSQKEALCEEVETHIIFIFQVLMTIM